MDAPIRIKRDAELAPLTTFGIGGPADLLARPASADELVAIVRWARANELPWMILGLGANILVGDKGFRGLVIKNEAGAHRIDGTKLTAESGSVVGDLVEITARQGLSGLEHYQNIPSTLGGAMWQNLHFLSYPHERTYFIEEIVESAEVLRGDAVETVGEDYFKFGYDTSVLHETDDIVLSVTLRLSEAPKAEIELRREKNAAWRAEKHPPGAAQMSAGSIFQKIEGAGAGRLIDQAGLKGYRVGGAEVSERHANYILNVDNATAADVRALIAHIQETVEKTSGHRLEPEISFVGEF